MKCFNPRNRVIHGLEGFRIHRRLGHCPLSGPDFKLFQLDAVVFPGQLAQGLVASLMDLGNNPGHRFGDVRIRQWWSLHRGLTFRRVRIGPVDRVGYTDIHFPVPLSKHLLNGHDQDRRCAGLLEGLKVLPEQPFAAHGVQGHPVGVAFEIH